MSLDVASLYDMHRHELRIFAMRQMHGEPPQDIEDVVHQTFAHAVAHADTFTDRDCQPKAWLYKIATNVIIDRRRRGSRKTDDGYERRVELVRIGSGADRATATVQPEYAMIENRVTLQPALDALPPAHRNAIILRFWYGFTSPEIGRLMGTSDNSIKKYHQRALLQMRKVLTEGQTDRERRDEVAELYAAGLSTKQIAAATGMTVSGVNRRLKRAGVR